MTSQNAGGDIASGKGNPEVEGQVSDARAAEMLQNDKAKHGGNLTDGDSLAAVEGSQDDAKS